MLIVTGTITVDPGQMDEVMSAARDAMRASRAESGCVAYTFSPDPLEPGVLNVLECWNDQHALSTHLSSAHIATFLERIGPALTGMDVLKHQVASSGPVFE
jgi:quinol monooxygenase YgiN